MTLSWKNPGIISVVLGGLSLIVTTLTPYASSNWIVGVVVTAITSVAAHLATAEPAAPTSNPVTTTVGGGGSGGGGSTSSPITQIGGSIASFILTASQTAALKGAQSVVLSVVGGAPNGQFQIQQAEGEGSVSAWYHLDNTGAGSFTVTLNTDASPIPDILDTEGVINVYALDSAGNKSNVITLSE
jgi:hypothetical protein